MTSGTWLLTDLIAVAVIRKVHHGHCILKQSLLLVAVLAVGAAVVLLSLLLLLFVVDVGVALLRKMGIVKKSKCGGLLLQ